jgi:hypothetical protein
LGDIGLRRVRKTPRAKIERAKQDSLCVLYAEVLALREAVRKATPAGLMANVEAEYRDVAALRLEKFSKAVQGKAG